MGYYMRFFQTDDSDLNLSGIEAGLRQIDPAYAIERDAPDSITGLLKYRDDLYGEIELNRRGEGLADEEIEEFRERVAAEGDGSTEQVLQTLDECRCIVALRLLFRGFDNLDRIAPLWDLLFQNCEGLMQADSEGFYDSEGLILSVS